VAHEVGFYQVIGHNVGLVFGQIHRLEKVCDEFAQWFMIYMGHVLSFIKKRV